MFIPQCGVPAVGFCETAALSEAAVHINIAQKTVRGKWLVARPGVAIERLLRKTASPKTVLRLFTTLVCCERNTARAFYQVAFRCKLYHSLKEIQPIWTQDQPATVWKELREKNMLWQAFMQRLMDKKISGQKTSGSRARTSCA